MITALSRIILLVIVSVTLHSDTLTSQPTEKVKIAYISAPSVIGKYSHNCYNVTLAALLSYHQPFELKAYEMADESEQSLIEVLSKISNDRMDAIMAPLTLNGAKNLKNSGTAYTVFIPTVHKRDVASAPSNFIFGAIDYKRQIEALIPYMANSMAVFYDNSTVGNALSLSTKEVASERKSSMSLAMYPIDVQGSNIVTYLAKPSLFSKKSIMVHLPIVKTSMLISHLTFTGVKENNILSTQINYDPTLITLTQYPDRRNMIIANSIIEHVPSIYESSALMNIDITFDWIQYTTSVGADYLISDLLKQEREYNLRIIDSQVIYPVELLRPKENGFEPLNKK